MSGALKKVTGSSSSRSSSHRSSTPTPSYTHQDEQAKSQAPEEQPAQQQEEEAPNDSHLDIRGERELQAYNILKDRTFGHTWEFDEDMLEKTGMKLSLRVFGKPWVGLHLLKFLSWVREI